MASDTEAYLNSSYIGPDFVRINAVKIFHSFPRLGNTNDISSLVSSNPEVPSNYITGAVYFSIILYIIYSVWALLILSLKFCTDGFLAGRNFLSTHPRRPRRVRIAFLVSASLVFILSIILLAKGTKDHYKGVNELQESAEESLPAIREIISINDNLIKIGHNTTDIRTSLIPNLENMCPAQKLLDLDEKVDPVQVAKTLDDLSSALVNNVAAYQGQMIKIENGVTDVSNSLYTYNQWDWLWVLLVSLLLICTAVMATGVICVWVDESASLQYVNFELHTFQCCLTYVVLPLFVILTICTCLASGAFGIFELMNADTCSGGDTKSPTGTIKSIMIETGINPNSLEAEYVLYVIEGCRGTSPLTPFLQDLYDLNKANQQLSAFLSAVDIIGVNTISFVCQNDIAPIYDDATLLHQNLIQLHDSLTRLIELSDCQFWNEIYVKAMYSGACTNNVRGMAWMYALLAVISLCGLIMIMLRASWLDVVQVADGSEEHGKSDLWMDKVVVHEPSAPPNPQAQIY